MGSKMSKMITFIPKIRFKDYLNDWPYTELKEVKDVRDGTHASPNYFFSGYPLVTSKNLTDSGLNLNDVSLISESDYNEINKRSKVEIGDILLGLIGTIGKPVLIEEAGFAIKNVGLIKKDGQLQNQFLLQYLKTDLFNKYIQIEMAGNTQKFLGLETLRKTKVPVPSQKEQSAIGTLFRTLDDLLASYKDNLANYQSLKATMLSKMFPKAGQTVPEIRLDGFEGEWRIIKLGDVLSELKSGLSRELSNDDIGLPVIRANNISDGNLNLDRDIKYWFKVDPKGANTANYFVKENDILVNFINSEAKMGTAAIVSREPNRETIYTTNILKLTVKEDYYPYFIYLMTFVQSYQNYIKSITKPAVNQASFTTVDFKKYEFLCPAFQEQKAIGTYFSNLENLIAAHQEKISQLETLKKKLLQDMFI